MARRALGPELGLEYMPKIPSARWFHWPGALTTAAQTLNSLRAYPYRLPRQQFTDISCEVTTASTSGFLRLAIYDNDPSGLYPSAAAPLLDAGQMSSGAVGLVNWGSLTFTPPQEIVWIALVPQTSTCTLRVMTDGQSCPLPGYLPSGSTPGTSSARIGLSVASITGAAPTNPTWIAENNLAPKLWFKAA